MAEISAIEWCDRTFSPWEGCQKVGPGCDHCYAETRNARFAPKGQARVAPHWGPGAARRVMSDAYWRAPLRWNSELAAAGRRETVFPSLCDPFDNAAPEGQRARFADLIVRTPALEWLLLTKRIGNALDMLIEMFPNGVPKNVRVGATIVNNDEWLRDYPKMPAVRVATGRKLFLSCEPLLGGVDLDAFGPVWRQIVGWVIAGGESGADARPMNPDWVRQIRAQCQPELATLERVQFLFKQWGEWAPGSNWRDDETIPSGTVLFWDDERDENRASWRVGKKAAGRMLDGVLHNDFPEEK